MSAPVSNVRSMRDFIPEQDVAPEWNPTQSLDKQIAQARKEMGEARWAELNAEWDEPAQQVRSQGVRQWIGGAL